MTTARPRARRAACRMLLAVVLAGVLPACAGSGATASPPPDTPTRVELFFGRTILGGGVVSDAEWNTYLHDTLLPALGGVTVVDARGAWRDQDGVHEEPSLVVVHLFAPEAYAATRRSVAAVVGAYKERFHQDTVLVAWSECRFTFE